MYNYLIVISFIGDLTIGFFGKFNCKTPLTYSAEMMSASTFSSIVKERLKDGN
jgi:hypothetical protein